MPTAARPILTARPTRRTAIHPAARLAALAVLPLATMLAAAQPGQPVIPGLPRSVEEAARERQAREAQVAAERAAQDAARAAEQAKAPTVTLKFPGGTLDEFARALVAGASNGTVNVVVRPSVSKAPIPPMELRGIDPYTAAMAVSGLELPDGGRLNVEPMGDRRGPVLIVITRDEQWDRNRMAMAGRLPGSNQRSIEILSVNALAPAEWAATPDAPRLPIETVLSAIETAVRAASPDEPAAEIKFHKDSGLLFVHGSPDQRAAAERAVDHLQRDLSNAGPRRGGGQVTTLEFELGAARPEWVVDAFRAVFPPDPMRQMRSPVQATARDGGVVVQTPADLASAVRAIVTYIDRPDSPVARIDTMAMQTREYQQRVEELMREFATGGAREEARADEFNRRSAEMNERLRGASAQMQTLQKELDAMHRRNVELSSMVDQLRQQLDQARQEASAKKEAGKPQ